MTNPTNLNEDREKLLSQCSVQASKLLNKFNKINSLTLRGRILFSIPIDHKLKDVSCNTQRSLKNFNNQQLKNFYNFLRISNNTFTKTIQTVEDLDKQCKEIDYLIQEEDKNIFTVWEKLTRTPTENASIAEEIHNTISAIKAFIKRVIDFLVSKVRNIGGKNPGSSETNSHSFFPDNGSKDDTATPSHCSPTLNTA